MVVLCAISPIEHRRERLLNAKRKETIKWRSLERITSPIYAVETKPLRIHTIIDESTTNVNGLRYDGESTGHCGVS